MLEQSDIAHYLLSLGLVKPRDVLDEGLVIADASRRNSVFLATTRAGPTHVVKQAGPRGAGTLENEARVLRRLAGAPELAALVPAVVHHDPGAALLVLRTPGGGRDWGEHHRPGRYPRILPRSLGRALAALHRLDPGEPPPGADPMWGLSLPEPPHALLLDLSEGARDLVARVQASRAVCDRLDALREAASADALVHGDLRWDNCLALAPPGARRRTRVLLLDWELAGRGPPALDVGTVLAEYLAAWVGSIPIVEPADPGRHVARAGRPLPLVRPAMQAFWDAYRAAAARRPSLRRVVELAAVRLLQTAVEQAQNLVTPSARVVTTAQLAGNMLTDPDDAGVNLMGLRE